MSSIAVLRIMLVISICGIVYGICSLINYVWLKKDEPIDDVFNKPKHEEYLKINEKNTSIRNRGIAFLIAGIISLFILILWM